jgi:hypothetical protein
MTAHQQPSGQEKQQEPTDVVNPSRESFTGFRRDFQPQPLLSALVQIEEVALRSPESLDYARRRVFADLAEGLPAYLDWPIRIQEESERIRTRPRTFDYIEIRLSVWPASWTKEILSSICTHRAFILDLKEGLKEYPGYESYLLLMSRFLLTPKASCEANALVADWVNHPTHKIVREKIR